MYPLRPLFARARRKLQNIRIEDLASERVEISPAIVSNRPRAIFADDELERIQDTYEILDFELARVNGGIRNEGSTIGYAIDDVILTRGAIYKNIHSSYLRSDEAKFFDFSLAQKRKEGVLVTNSICELYFGHWVSESPLLRLIAEGWDKPSIQLEREPYFHQREYEALSRLPAETVGTSRFERLWIIDDRGMNASRRDRMLETRARLRSSVRPEAMNNKVFMLRGATGKGRNILNQTEVVEFVKRYGFSILEPEKSSVREILSALSGAAFVITVEGSAQNHALLSMPSRSTLILLQPENRFTASAKDIADLIDVDVAFTVLEAKGDDLTVDLLRLARLFALLGI